MPPVAFSGIVIFTVSVPVLCPVRLIVSELLPEVCAIVRFLLVAFVGYTYAMKVYVYPGST